MQLNTNFLQLRPKVAILDDDKELITDLIACLNSDIEIEGFSDFSTMASCVLSAYEKFLTCLIDCFEQIKTPRLDASALQTSFDRLIRNKPFTVALIDLNLGESHDLEGFEISEELGPLSLKSIIYTGTDYSPLSIDLINQGIISGYMNKSCDLYEDLLPAIFSLSREFYYTHFNITHLACLKSSSYVKISQNMQRLSKLSSSDEFIVYDEAMNYLSK